MIVIVSQVTELAHQRWMHKLQQAAVHLPARGVSKEKEFMILPHHTFKYIEKGPSPLNTAQRAADSPAPGRLSAPAAREAGPPSGWRRTAGGSPSPPPGSPPPGPAGHGAAWRAAGRGARPWTAAAGRAAPPSPTARRGSWVPGWCSHWAPACGSGWRAASGTCCRWTGSRRAAPGRAGRPDWSREGCPWETWRGPLQLDVREESEISHISGGARVSRLTCVCFGLVFPIHMQHVGIYYSRVKSFRQSALTSNTDTEELDDTKKRNQWFQQQKRKSKEIKSHHQTSKVKGDWFGAGWKWRCDEENNDKNHSCGTKEEERPCGNNGASFLSCNTHTHPLHTLEIIRNYGTHTLDHLHRITSLELRDLLQGIWVFLCMHFFKSYFAGI